MARDGAGSASTIWHRLAGFLGRRAAGPPFIDPRTHSWARQIKSYSELPSQYRPFFEGRAAGIDGAFPYAVLTPTFRGGYGRPEPERLLCILDGCVYVLEPAGESMGCTRYAPDQITLVEYGVLLLHSWITMQGQVGDGAAQSTTVRFNSVTDYLMAPFVDCLRGPTTDGSAAALETERAKLDHLAESHYKFRTYGRASLRSGASICSTVLQPEIRRVRIRLPGMSLTRMISPAHLGILSNSELITIRDDPGQRWAKGSPHGAIWTYIPRGKITGAGLAPRGDGTLELLVELRGGQRLRSLFGSEMHPQLEQLVAELKSSATLEPLPALD